MRSDAPSGSIDSHEIPLRIKLLLAVLFTVVVLFVHGGSLLGEFLFDDFGSIVDNQSIRDRSNLFALLWKGEYTTVAGRPLLNLSLAVNYALGGIRPAGYHLANYLFHAMAAFALFALLRRVLLEVSETRSAATSLALMISLLWCVHPLTINAVSYVSQRAESIASLAYLTVLWAFLKGVQTSQRRWFLVSVAAAWLGAFTKEIIATVPLAVMALDGLVVARSFRIAWRRHWRVYLSLLTSWIPLAYWMWTSKTRAGTVGFGIGITLQEHVQTQIWALARYLRLTIWPQPLIFDYGDQFVVTDLGQVAAAGSVMIAFGLLVAWLLFSRPALAFPGIAFCLLLGPTSVIPIATQTVAEHRMYLASANILGIVVVTLFLAIKRQTLLFAGTPKTQLCGLVALLTPMLLALGTQTVQHTRKFRTEDSIWNDTLQKHPTNLRAYYTLAVNNCKANGDRVAALRLCDQGIAVQGRSYYTRCLHEVRGAAHTDLKQYDLAYEDFSRAISLDPTIIDDWYHRAAILRDLGRYDEAIHDLDEARKLDPANLTTELVQGSVYAARGELAQALECYDRLLAKAPTHVAARRHRVALYAKLSRWRDAAQEIRRLQQEGHHVDKQFVENVNHHFAERPEVEM